MELFGDTRDFKYVYYERLIRSNKNLAKDFLDIFQDGPYNAERIVYKSADQRMCNVLKKYNSVISTNLNIGNKVYFHPKSEFPRFKLMGTTFKRTIKPEKADVIVIPKAESQYGIIYENMKVYEGDDGGLYGISDETFTYYFNSEKNFKDLVKKWNNLSLEYKETIGITIINKKLKYVLEIAYNNYNKPIITDDMLDLEVSKTLATLTESDIDSIDAMLASTDSSVVELGLKTLCGFNVFETPTIIKTLLCKNYGNIQFNKAMDSVSVRKMLNSVDMFRRSPGSFPGWMYCLADPNDKFSDFEITQVKRLLMPLFKDYIDRNICKLQTKNAPFIPVLKWSCE